MKTVAFYNPIDVIIIIAMTKEIFNEGQNNFCCNGVVSMDRANDLKLQKIIYRQNLGPTFSDFLT